MKTLRTLLILMAMVIGADAQIITSWIVITNTPAGLTSNLTINASTRSWTNSITGSPGTLIQTTNNPLNSATNLINHLTQYPISTAHRLRQTTPTNVLVSGAVGEALTITLAGGWGFVTNSTQTVSSPTFVVRVPITVEQPSNRTHIASLLVTALEGATNAFTATVNALTNFENLYHPQTIAGNKTFTGSNSFVKGGWNGGAFSNATVISGVAGAMTNGYHTNSILDSPISTNLVNRGAAISSPGTNGVASEQFGTGARATNANSLAVGNTALALGSSATAIGASATATSGGDLALGSGAFSEGGNAMAIGVAAEVHNTNSIAIGRDVSINHDNSVAIGSFSFATTSNQVTLGTSSQTVTVPGVFAPAGTLTNLTIRGTNAVKGSMAWSRYDLSTLGNGNNIAVPFGTNKYIRLSGTLTAAASICGIVGGATSGGQDGQEVNVLNDTGFTVTFAANTIDPVPANRIQPSLGTDEALIDQGYATLFYDTSASRWNIASTFPSIANVTNLSLASGSLATNTAAYTLATNDFVMNQYYTNAAQRASVYCTVNMTNILGSDVSKVSLFLDQDGDGNWEMQGVMCRLNGLALLAGAEELSAALQPSARFMFTNQSTGTASASINANSSQWVKQ